MSLCYDSEKWLMISLTLVAISLTIGLANLAYGQTNETQTQEGTLFNCYTSVSTTFPMFNTFTPLSVDLTDPDIKDFISNVCNFHHEKTGIWPDLSDPSSYTSGNFTEIKSNYYPNGMPQSVQEIVNQMNNTQVVE